MCPLLSAFGAPSSSMEPSTCEDGHRSHTYLHQESFNKVNSTCSSVPSWITNTSVIPLKIFTDHLWFCYSADCFSVIPFYILVFCLILTPLKCGLIPSMSRHVFPQEYKAQSFPKRVLYILFHILSSDLNTSSGMSFSVHFQ